MNFFGIKVFRVPSASSRSSGAYKLDQCHPLSRPYAKATIDNMLPATFFNNVARHY
jgi:hypothetical protein